MTLSRILSAAGDSPVLFEDGRWWSGSELLTAGLTLAGRLAGPTAIVARCSKAASVVAAAVCAEAATVNVTYLDPSLDHASLGIRAASGYPRDRCGSDGPADAGWLLEERATAVSPLVAPLGEPSYSFMSSGSTATPNRIVRSVRATSVDSPRIADAVYQGHDGVVLAAPCFHLYGFSHLVAALGRGLRVWAVTPSASLSVIAAAVDRPEVQVFTGLPFHLDLVLRSSSTGVFSGLSALLSSAGRLSRSVIDQALAAALPLYNIYGSTETGTLAIGDARSVPDPFGYVGQPLPGVEIRLTRSADSDEGPLHIRTDGLAEGIIRDGDYLPGLTVDGWFPTTDIGRMGPKGLWLVGRQAEFLKVAGARVSCARIREVLLRCPGVHDAEVFGVEDKVRGEVPACRVVLEPGTSVGHLHGWCAAELNPIEVPRSIEPVDHIPRSATGKIMRWL
ncbi:hypothetical protein B5D80_14965 [Micromonospora wenchangensis]|uniref:AMP-dependent synthetase/ligase domain-containing protein n=1 Tax=Micromonospora wenchangensis TaxID=1185415 RepID=A0A246RLE4_9ACTN|nr:fatty acid--CoA ligase family protein [Micromonospora wenchangensis]OWV07085.1 hypothetical protein B5D80_14965 [Micromonospora wenchangensis]